MYYLKNLKLAIETLEALKQEIMEIDNSSYLDNIERSLSIMTGMLDVESRINTALQTMYQYAKEWQCDALKNNP